MEPRRKGPRGLAAIAQTREQRARGGTRWTAQAGLVAAGAVVLALIAHKVIGDRTLASDRRTLLGKQHAVAATLGAEWYPLRADLETTVLNAAKAYAGDDLAPEARTGAFRGQPGLYLRMRVADATGVDRIRTVAAEAKKDAFAACFLRERNERGLRGEIDGGAFAEQPWNLGQAYAATRILTDEWAQSVREADDEMRMRFLQREYESAAREAIPLAIDVVKRAEFFLLVLDEDVPEAAPFADGGSLTEDALQLVGHPARVYLVDLKSHKEILRLRRSGDARIIPAGERLVTDEETRDAMQRQANNCALASAVEAALAR